MTYTDGHDQRQVRIQKLRRLEALGINPFPALYKREHFAAPLHEQYKDLPPETTTADRVKVAGRIRSIRNSGMFVDRAFSGHNTGGILWPGVFTLCSASFKSQK